MTNARLFSKTDGLIDWEKIEWSFDGLELFLKPLLGHLIHRELRTFGRYPHFYFYFDQSKALQIWNYWNQLKVIVPFNGIIPKGEIGINPAYPELKYKIYLGRVLAEGAEESSLVEIEKELGFKLVPRLIDPKFVNMREQGRVDKVNQ